MRSHGREVGEKSPDLPLLFVLLLVCSYVSEKEKPNFPLQKRILEIILCRYSVEDNGNWPRKQKERSIRD